MALQGCVIGGMWMVVSDLHGNGLDFQRVLDRFEHFQKRYPDLRLLFLGDLIHSFNYKTDQSYPMVCKLMELGANSGHTPFYCLMGNHEMAHVYHWVLQRGNWDFTKGFEWKMAKNRASVIAFFEAMPLWLATQGGVLLHHTGAAGVYAPQWLQSCGLTHDFLYSPNHAAIKRLTLGHDTDEGRFCREIGDKLIQLPHGRVMWEALMNGNEHQYGSQYQQMQGEMLCYYSQHLGFNLNLIVTGHIGVDSGIGVVGSCQVRICSGQGCTDDLQKKVVVLDANRIYSSAEELAKCAVDLY